MRIAAPFPTIGPPNDLQGRQEHYFRTPNEWDESAAAFPEHPYNKNEKRMPATGIQCCTEAHATGNSSLHPRRVQSPLHQTLNHKLHITANSPPTLKGRIAIVECAYSKPEHLVEHPRSFRLGLFPRQAYLSPDPLPREAPLRLSAGTAAKRPLVPVPRCAGDQQERNAPELRHERTPVTCTTRVRLGRWTVAQMMTPNLNRSARLLQIFSRKQGKASRQSHLRRCIVFLIIIGKAFWKATNQKCTRRFDVPHAVSVLCSDY